MKKLLMLVALFGFTLGCGSEPANDQDAELDTMEQGYDNPEAADAATDDSADGSETKPGSDTK